MKLKKILFPFLFFCFFMADAQTASIKNADKKYDSYAYADAIKAYEKLVEKGVREERIFQRLGNSYYFIGELKDALKYYQELFSINENQEADYLYKYAQCLKSEGNYAKADEILEKFSQKAPSDKRAVLFSKSRNYLEDIKSNSGRFDIADAGINSKDSDYGSTILDNKLVFTSARDTGSIIKKNFKWTNKAISTLYAVDLNPDGSIGKPMLFHKQNLQVNFNQSTPVFTKDGRTMYFTRNNSVDRKRKQNENKVTFLKLYKAVLINNEWKEVQELPFNSDEYSVAHPALSVDEKTLYFASDMPGTLGLSDIYKVSLFSNGAYGTPENLGPEINTEGRETFPFISDENELYFASDGRPGLGGLDIYVSKITKEGTFEEVQNVGEPINSKQDDFAFIINSKNRNGFFSSNRANGHGLDDVYRFTENRRLICEQQISGIITDQETNEKLSNVALILFDETGKTAIEAKSDANGNYVFSNVRCGKKYYIKTSKEDYLFKEVSITLKKATGSASLPIALEKKPKPITAIPVVIKTNNSIKPVKVTIAVGTDLGKLLKIPMNFFDLGKATIKKTSEPQLQKMVDMLNQYPTIKVDIRSHTDSRSSSESNQILSDKRAQSTKDWLVSKGINADRLTAKGFGETQLVNKCADGVKCTEQQHQQNRRSEFIITSL
ncbi:outer membrane protein OmpA-like peptidoglycan-associated protein/tetratricopeptide (TPR) repeat protein [Flavobacterium sp. HSC-32F16]|uniref:OmpA family protein n=1 Tax=Flavobacterium sp. HSC-32F16 TaxID=2910964 RepID=UPI0020A4F47E|nr:OmpA family protein [Flavobacterium sp. HSC-32F16]MCP2027055.1 outer membrane protein OmpA-like peptidoglycan-associated protein/tetratricopeptide (TPR) repeat protein [Flavobacterium sp. HSC-32F16]